MPAVGRKEVALLRAHPNVVHGIDAGFLELVAIGRGKVEEELASVIRPHEPALELRCHLIADLIAAAADARPDARPDVAAAVLLAH